MGIAHLEKTRAIIGAAIEVHRTLGPGFIESIYERALCVELARRRIPFRRQITVPIHYRSVEVGRHVVDMLIDGNIVVELKAIAQLLDVHCVTLRSYLNALRHDIGLILNFSKPTLDIKRVYRSI